MTTSKDPAGRQGPVHRGQVIANYGRALAIERVSGKIIKALALRRLGYVACGDQVDWIEHGDGQAVVTAVAERTACMQRIDNRGRVRTLAANFDQLVIVAAAPPGFDDRLIDSYLVMAAHLGVRPMLLLNKRDAWDATATEQAVILADRYRSIGYTVVSSSTVNDDGMDALAREFDGRTSILVGQSGVGKSSVADVLLPDREIRIGALSKAGQLGRHTTSNTILYRLPTGGSLIDSPGVREFSLDHLPESALQAGYPDLTALAGNCRFHNCRHRNEPGCAVRAGAETGRIDPQRYDNYLQLSETIGGLINGRR